jgi:spermidine synthase
MTNAPSILSSDSVPNGPSAGRGLPLLLLLFSGSGIAALIYEIIWFQLLQAVIGSTAVSMGFLLGMYMGGLCLGSLFFARLVSRRRHPMRVYALLELGIGLIGIVVLFIIPFVDRVYSAAGGHSLLSILLRGAVCAICLLPPTILMGATLPALSRWLETTPRGVSRLGFLYGANTAGAVFGCLLAGFYLLRIYDTAVATFVAAAVNGAIALVALLMAGRARYAMPAVESSSADSAERPFRAPQAWTIYVTIGLSGLCAMGAEVVWTRLLSLMLGGTVYTFSIILAVFLVGIGLGSSIGSLLARGRIAPRVSLGWSQMLLAAATAWTAWMLAKSLPFMPVNGALTANPWLTFQLDLMRCLWALLPAALLWGASFPLALAAVAVPGQDPGRLVGGIYAANTVGTIFGSLGFSLLLIPWLGTQNCQRLLIGLSAVAGLLAFAPLIKAFWQEADASTPAGRARLKLGGPISVAVAVLMALLFARTVAKLPWGLVAHGRQLPTKLTYGSPLYVGEGMNASVAVTELDSGIRNFHISGRVEASNDPQDMRMERMLGHVPALLHPGPESILVVGCGAGVTAGTFVNYPSVKRIVICEIEPLIPKVVARYFGSENNGVLEDPRLTIIYDDARHFILTTKEKFDVITSDPIHPWIKGSAMLYTKEYFELCKKRLNQGGVMTQWVPLYESTTDTVKSEIATFLEVFPYGTVWSNDYVGQGYDVITTARIEPMKIDVDELAQRLKRTDYQAVAMSLREVGFKNAFELLSIYAGQASDLAPWLKGAQVNRDRNLRLQYLAGLGLNLYQSGAIYNDLISYRTYPENIFTGMDDTLRPLRELMTAKK